MAQNVLNQDQPPKHPSEGGDKQTYMAWAKQKYGEQYEVWMPWIEDTFLKYFTKDNKASYATKGEYFSCPSPAPPTANPTPRR